MKKYLVQIEFRYLDAPKSGFNYTQHNKTITIGVFDNFNDACKNGNKYLEILESNYKIHGFPDGREAKKQRFSETGGAFGHPKNLITNLAYLKTPFDFFAKIETLNFTDINETINEVNESVKRYINYKQNESNHTHHYCINRNAHE